jgi:hypothetical protein
MLSRRSVLSLVSLLLTRTQGQPKSPSSPCRLPETLTLDLGSGACAIKQLEVKAGALRAVVPISELLAALDAKTQ